MNVDDKQREKERENKTEIVKFLWPFYALPRVSQFLSGYDKIK